MTPDPFERLLGRAERDSGCEAAFEQFDRFCDAVLGGRDVAREFPDIVTHIANCAACREDTEGLLAALRQLEEEKGS
jgi:hypothetical protein